MKLSKSFDNGVENAVRPIALSRKNFLFCGNHEAAESTAVICSFLGSCKELGVNPREWLTEVIAKMPYYQKPGNEENLKKLLPNYWRKEVSNEIEQWSNKSPKNPVSLFKGI